MSNLTMLDTILQGNSDPESREFLKQQIKDLILETVDVDWFIGKEAYDKFLAKVEAL